MVNPVHDRRAHLGAPGKIRIEMHRIEVAGDLREFALVAGRERAAGENRACHLRSRI